MLLFLTSVVGASLTSAGLMMLMQANAACRIFSAGSDQRKAVAHDFDHLALHSSNEHWHGANLKSALL